MATGKTIALIIWTFISKVMSLLFYMLSRVVLALFPRNKHLLISGLQSLSAVILKPKKIKSVTVSTFPPSICHEVMGQHAVILVFCMLSFKPAFSLSSLTIIKRLFRFSSLFAIRVISSVKSYSLTPLFQSHQLHSQAFLLWQSVVVKSIKLKIKFGFSSATTCMAFSKLFYLLVPQFFHLENNRIFHWV